MQRIPASSSSPKEMLTVSKLEDSRTKVRINSSSLSILQTCARKAQYTLHEGWRSRNVSPPLVFGQAIHKALEVFYSHPGRERTIPADFNEVALLLASGHVPPEPHFLYDAILAFIQVAEPLRTLPDTDKRSLSSGIWMLSHYFRIYLHDTYIIHSDEHGPMIERQCAATLYEDGDLVIELFGTVDFIMRNEVTNEILAGDHKTTSMMGHEFLNRVKPNHQYTGYIFLAKAALGIDSDKFMVNGLQTKARPLTARGGPPTFTRQITNRTLQDIGEFRNSVVDATRRYLFYQETKCWPIGHVDSCANYGGCGYLDICSAPNNLRLNILEAKYERTQQ